MRYHLTGTDDRGHYVSEEIDVGTCSTAVSLRNYRTVMLTSMDPSPPPLRDSGFTYPRTFPKRQT
jgi:hypothetical protein